MAKTINCTYCGEDKKPAKENCDYCRDCESQAVDMRDREELVTDLDE